MDPGLKDDGIALLQRAPFAPGQSPFKIKGVAYRGHLDYVDKHVPGGNAAVIQQLGDERFDAFFNQPFLAASLYDVFPLAQAGIACGQLCGTSFLGFVAQRTRAQVEIDIRGVYRWLAKLANSQSLAARIPRVIGQYTTFAKGDSVVGDDGRVTTTTTGLPLPIVPWWNTVHQAYTAAAVELAGKAKVVESSIISVESDGAQIEGVPTMRMVNQVTIAAGG